MTGPTAPTAPGPPRRLSQRPVAAVNAGPLAGITFRPGIEGDLAECNRIWRESIDAYLLPMGFPPLPTDNPALRRLHAHTLATDPSRFVVAEHRRLPGRRRVVAFGSAVERGPLWFLSMLFVEPGRQARGVGRSLLERILPAPLDGRVLATCTDSAQPVSNGLYASLGIVPRMPLFNLIGRPRPGSEWPPLPEGLAVQRVADYGPWRDDPEAQALDRSILGFAHPEDHRFVLEEPRRAFAYRTTDGQLAAYGYAGDVGRVGPIAVSEPGLLAPVLGHLLTAVEPRGASSVWLPGDAAEAIGVAVRGGLRIEGFPILAGWSRPFADFTRYVPTSPGLI
jgi:GNAT superfamily N-acetyltransferase